MAQHFLLSAASRTISEVEVARMSEDEARVVFEKLRWSDGKPTCPTCGSCESYTICFTSKSGKNNRRYKCRDCRSQYTVTSGTIFANHKLELRDYLLAIIIFSNATKGISASQLSRALGVQYKTAFVLLHKLRASIVDSQSDDKLSGIVEMDGCYVGKIKPKNRKIDRLDLRLVNNPNKRCVLVARQRAQDESLGAIHTRAFIVKSENSYAINKIATSTIKKDSTIHTDGATGYNELHSWYEVLAGDHSKAYKSDNGACSNQAESYFSRFRRAQYGQYHKISNLYLSNYANEISYKEDCRRFTNKEIMLDVAHKAINTPTHNEWTGYWQGNKRVSERLIA